MANHMFVEILWFHFVLQNINPRIKMEHDKFVLDVIAIVDGQIDSVNRASTDY